MLIIKFYIICLWFGSFSLYVSPAFPTSVYNDPIKKNHHSPTRNRSENQKKKLFVVSFFRFVSSTSPASHAPQHSLLLLDLDQLVVVSPNLDKLLTIASSAAYSDSVVGHRSRRSSSASSSTSSSLTANCTPHHTLHPKSSSPINPTFPSHLSPIIATTSSTTTPYIHHVTNTSCGGSAAPLLDDHTRRRGLFDHFLDSSKCLLDGFGRFRCSRHLFVSLY